MTTRNTPDRNSVPRKVSLLTNSLARAHSTPMRNRKPRTVCKASKVLPLSPPTHTLVVRKKRMAERTMAISRVLQRTSCGSSGLLLVMIWITSPKSSARALRSCKGLSEVILTARYFRVQRNVKMRSVAGVQGERRACDEGQAYKIGDVPGIGRRMRLSFDVIEA